MAFTGEPEAHRHLSGNCRDLANLDDTQLAFILAVLLLEVVFR